MMILDERGAEIHHSEPRLGVNSMKDGQRTRLRNWQAQKKDRPVSTGRPISKMRPTQASGKRFRRLLHRAVASRNNLKPSATSNAPKTIA